MMCAQATRTSSRIAFCMYGAPGPFARCTPASELRCASASTYFFPSKAAPHMMSAMAPAVYSLQVSGT
eukprot:CAMPEP_0184377442 /NCGR_PEP_ID=MMETSP0007-20130409/2265_1 /TAXON_ID=97485 /ORGANISM="Prymnesium parvum, Strain Texoma1" /LENGTH=67 /DNA_ID=CAMNT_0026721333 /DNA_START=196 /DNA_END=399 /DNA_ORIENTATION=+